MIRPAEGDDDLMIRRIHHKVMHTRSLDALRQFYKDAFEFELVGAKEC